MATPREPESIRQVSCPNCQAKPGEDCTQPTDTGRRPFKAFHLARVDKFEAEKYLAELHRQVPGSCPNAGTGFVTTFPPPPVEDEEAFVNSPRRAARRQAIFDDAEQWLDSLRSDIHWARTPRERQDATKKALILSALIDMAKRA